MKRASFLFLAVVFLVSGLASAQTYSGSMVGGAAEVPPGDPDGTGLAVVRINGNVVQWQVGVSNIAAPTAGHIHRGAPGVAGPIVIGFEPLGFINGVASGAVTVTDQALLDEIRANPGNFYVNIHNAEFPGGAVRAQLASATAFSSRMAGGDAEVPPGDPDGFGFTIVAVSGSNVHFFYTVSNINQPTAAHIHEAGPGVAGGIVVGFPPPPAGNTHSGTVAVTDQDLLNRLRTNPTSFYVNVHTDDFPGGAVRGQVGTTLRLGTGQFDVTVFATDQRTGRTSEGQAIYQNDLFGYHSLPQITTNPDNPEMFVKILDGSTINGRIWVFFNGLTDLDVMVFVRDTLGGEVKTYHKEPGSACGGFDTDAFPGVLP
jgi:hypothetical protein